MRNIKEDGGQKSYALKSSCAAEMPVLGREWRRLAWHLFLLHGLQYYRNSLFKKVLRIK